MVSTSSVTANVAAPLLASVSNFRDIAGPDANTTYVTREGRRLRRGRFYRSNVLTPNSSDWEILNTLNISVVYDLRTPDEISKAPDRLPRDVRYVPINVLCTPHANLPPQVHSADQAIDLMKQLQRAWVEEASMREQFGRVLQEMASVDGAQVFHCTAGKDRTGWVAALLHSIAGVDSSTIFDDYLLSNQRNEAWIHTIVKHLQREQGEEHAAAFQPLLSVQADFLHASLECATACYGSIDGYVRAGLGLSAQQLQRLRAQLLEGDD